MEEREYSISELMICVFSREVKDGDLGALPGVRSEVPLGTACLAARHHAPNLGIYTTHGDVDPLVMQITGTTSDYEVGLSSYRYHSLADYFDLVHAQSFSWAFYGGLQMDQYANLNLVCIGDWAKPRLRGPGMAGGASENWCDRMFVWLNEHSPRVLVPHVDFVGVPGFERDRAAYSIPGMGPDPVITPLAVMDVDRSVGRVRLRSVHPGVTVQQVVDNTGFELIVPDDVPETVPPTERELRLLRGEVDPKGILRRENIYG